MKFWVPEVERNRGKVLFASGNCATVRSTLPQEVSRKPLDEALALHHVANKYLTCFPGWYGRKRRRCIRYALITTGKSHKMGLFLGFVLQVHGITIGIVAGQQQRHVGLRVPAYGKKGSVFLNEVAVDIGIR
eukprot:3343155-Pyramimonas_sp.AAC.1